ncbi:MAG: type II secretion system F family protein [Victivallaceae bacterium]|nr:type II secretion system F family protein [Victivallaceae bacterium]
MSEISLLQQFITYGIVLAATVLLVYGMLRFVQKLALERIDREARDDRSSGLKNSIEYFIDTSSLHYIQLSLGILTSGIFVGVLLFAQVYNLIAIIGLGTLFFVIGGSLPIIYYKRKVAARAQEFENGMLDFVAGVTGALCAGQALPQAIEVFSRRSEVGPIKDELLIVLREYRLGQKLADALQHMYDRIPCEDLLLFVITVRLTLQSGGSMADVLQKITQTIRARREFKLKLRTLTAQGRFEALAMSLAPLVAFVLLFCINRDMMIVLVTTAIGWCAIGVMLTLEIIGYLVIRKIVNVEV